MVRRTVELKDLEAGQEYNVQIRAISDNEEYTASNWSTRLNFTTDEDTTGPGTVQGVEIKCVGAAFRATWLELALDGDGQLLNDLKDYKVVWQETSNPSNEFVAYSQTNVATLTYQQNVEELGGVEDITVLVYGRDYAHNLSTSPGINADTDAPPFITNLAPEFFTGLLADRDGTDSQAIAVEWPQPTGTATDGSNNADDLSYYEVFRDSVKIEDIAFSPGPTRYIDPDPRPGEHTYYVEAYDLFGNSIQSNSDTATPIYTVLNDTIPPDPPINLVLTPDAPENSRDGTEAFIDVEFDAPVTNDDGTDYEDNEGFIIKWRVTGTNDYFERYVSDTRQDPPTDDRAITARINELETSTEYEVSVVAYDTSRNPSSPPLVGTTTTPKDETEPDQPSAPTASNGVQSILVSHDLTTVLAEPLPNDVVDLAVYVSESNGFAIGDPGVEEVGTMSAVPGVTAVGKFSVNSEEDGTDSSTPKTLYVKVVAIDAAGNKSVASPQATSAPDLISGANILNATINDAKINTLSAAKLVAGSAFINDLQIQNKMTVKNSGFLKSGNWDGTDLGNASTQGWWIGDDGIVINDGTIEASAFTVIEQNLVPYQYSTFTNFERWYVDNTWTTGDSAGTEIGVNAWNRYAFQSLEWSADTNNDILLLSPAQTAYNVDVGAELRYVYSLYAYNPTGSSITIGLLIEDSDGLSTIGPNEVIPAGSYRRISFDYTTTATATGVVLGLENRNGGAAQVAIDGVQFEQITAEASGNPSRFTLPGGTRITGNSITTGQIESTDFQTGVSGWQIDLLGNVEFRDGLFRGEIEATSGKIDGGPFIVDGLLTATGSSGRLEMDTSGFRMYDAPTGGNLIIDMDTASGSATFAGDLSGASGTFVGELSGGTINIGGSDSSSFHVNSAGSMWTGAGTFASAPFKVSSTGALTASNANITGTINATSGTLSGTLTVTGTISGGTITGSTFRTASSGYRIVITGGANGELSFYDGNGAIKGFIGYEDSNDSFIVGGMDHSFTATDIRIEAEEAVRIWAKSIVTIRGDRLNSEQGAVYFTDGPNVIWKVARDGAKSKLYGYESNDYIDYDGSSEEWGIWLQNNREFRLGSLGVFMENVYNTTNSGSANVYTSSSGRLYRSSSSLRYKRNVQPWRADQSVLELEPVEFDGMEGNVRKGEELKPTGRRHLGLTAENIAEKFPTAAIYDEEGRPDAIDWNAVTAALISEVAALKAQVEGNRA